MDELFFKILTEKHKDLVETIKNKKFFLLVPPAKSIMQNYLTKNFYESHLFFQSEFDEKNYVDLHGKVLELNNNTFHTFIGYKKQMNFTIIDESFMETLGQDVKVIHVDNIIDENLHQTVVITTASMLKREQLRKCYSKDDYVVMFDNLITKNSNMEDIYQELSKLIDKLQINYVLVKGHVMEYSKFFRENCNEFTSFLSNKLSKYKSDDSFNTIIFELAESLIFNKIYSYLFNNLKSFNSEDESSLKQKFNSFKNEFSFSSYQVDQMFNLCKFKASIEELNKLPYCFTTFEKMVSYSLNKAILSQVNLCIVKEVGELFEEKNKHKKQKIQVTTNELVPIWIYILINSKVDNLLTETQMIQEFVIKSSFNFNEDGFQIANLISALEDLKKREDDKKQAFNGFYVNPFIINVKVNSDVNPYELYYKTNSDTNEKENNPNIFGNLINSFNPFAK